MKLNRIFINNVFALLASIPALADAAASSVTINEFPDPAIIVRPVIPDGSSIPDLPTATSVGRRYNANCYASYLIETVLLEKTPDGRGLKYGIRVQNIGTCPLTDLVITDFFPQNTLFQGASPRPKVLRSDWVTWVVNWLGVGESTVFDVQFFVGGPILNINTPVTIPPDRILNSACVWSKMVNQSTCAWQNSDQQRH